MPFPLFRHFAVSSLLVASIGVGVLPGVWARLEARTQDAGEQPYGVLVFSRTVGFRHDSIPAGIECIMRLGETYGFTVHATEDAAEFNPESLSRFKAIVFLNTTGDVLNDQQQLAMEQFIRAGNGFVGIHSAADTEYDWPWYGELVGAYFKSHPAIQPATVRVVDRRHPSTHHLAETWQRTDEWYNYHEAPPRRFRLLAMLDESTYSGGTMGEEHPIAWCQEHDGGRSWYTGGGHTIESFSEPDFVRHILGGIQWAAGTVEAPPASNPDPAPSP